MIVSYYKKKILPCFYIESFIIVIVLIVYNNIANSNRSIFRKKFQLYYWQYIISLVHFVCPFEIRSNYTVTLTRLNSIRCTCVCVCSLRLAITKERFNLSFPCDLAVRITNIVGPRSIGFIVRIRRALSRSSPPGNCPAAMTCSVIRHVVTARFDSRYEWSPFPGRSHIRHSAPS